MKRKLTHKMTYIAGVAVLSVIFSVRPASANSITESFTLSIAPTSPSASIGPFSFPATGLADFNPADGTLTEVSITLTGSVNWTTPAALDVLTANLVTSNAAAFASPEEFAGAAGSNVADLDLTGIVPLASMDSFIGTGTYSPGLLELSTVEPAANFSTTTPLSGTVTYDYMLPVTTPECSSLLLAGTGLIGLALAPLTRKRGNRP